ncbi:MAG: caspase family protein [Acidimicrobiia bacterium]|nr:caspase family protein [Acidimicrobiia bacterium]
MSSRTVHRASVAACALLLGLGLVACSNAHHASGRLLTRDAPVPTTDAVGPDGTAPDTPAAATNDVGPGDPTPALRPVAGGGGYTGGSTAHAVARPTPGRSDPFANLAPPGATPNVWAVVIGIQRYQGDTHATLGGEGDAAAFMQVLSNDHWPGDHILELVDGTATAANIRAAMQWLTRHSAPNTLTLFHYSGHVCIESTGPCGANHMYLWSVDNQFISDDEVGNNLRGLQGNAWVDIAGCEAAAFDKGISSSQRLFTAASQANEKGYEDPDWHESVWTGLAIDQGMLQGQADSNGDHVVTVQEAVRWAQSRATDMTQGQSHGPQHPVISSGQDFNLAQWAQPPPPPPPANGGGGNGNGGGGNGGGNGGGQPPSTTPPPQCNLLKSLLHC